MAKKIERKKTIGKIVKKKKDGKEQQPQHARRTSKYVGVNWDTRGRKWKSTIRIDSKKIKTLGYYQDEKEAARIFDENASLLGRPVNFPLHEGMEQAVKHRKGVSKMPNMNRPSKYVGVFWSKKAKSWEGYIHIGGHCKHLGNHVDEKEAARMYDEQAALLGRPVNFPLHEGMEQAVKKAPQRKNKAAVPNANRPSRYVGVTWSKHEKKWSSKIRVDRKLKFLGYYRDEKEAARMYDEQAALVGRSVNFPLHEGMQQAEKRRPKRKREDEK